MSVRMSLSTYRCPKTISNVRLISIREVDLENLLKDPAILLRRRSAIWFLLLAFAKGPPDATDSVSTTR